MPVNSEHEAIKICDENMWLFNKVYKGRGTNTGKLMLLANELITPNRYECIKRDLYIYNNNETDVKNCIIFTYLGGKRLFWSSRNKKSKTSRVSFRMSDAIKFSEDEAKSKVFCMNHSNKRDKNIVWRYLKLS